MLIWQHISSVLQKSTTEHKQIIRSCVNYSQLRVYRSAASWNIRPLMAYLERILTLASSPNVIKNISGHNYVFNFRR